MDYKSIMYYLYLLLVVILSSFKLFIKGQCVDNNVVELQYGEEEDFKINIVPPNKKFNPSMSLRKAPSPGVIEIVMPEQKIIITSRSSLPFTVKEFVFLFGWDAKVAVVRFMSGETEQKILKVKGHMDYLTVSVSAGDGLPKNGLESIDSIEVFFDFIDEGKEVTVKGVYLKACLEQGLWQPSDPKDTREDFFNRYGLTKRQFRFLSREVPEVKAMIMKLYSQRETKSESILFGDMLMLPRQIRKLKEQIRREAGNIINRPKRKLTTSSKDWPNGVLLYKVDNVFTGKEKKTIEEAMVHWTKFTCIRFKKLSLRDKTKKSHVLFTKNIGCWSIVGRNTAGPQIISLATKCLSHFSTPVHEMGHALGFYHEQSRPDRDSFVKVIFNKIVPGNESNFIKYDSIKTLKVPYDSSSIMHYSGTRFAINGSLTIKAVDPLFQAGMGQRTGLTFYDLKLVNLEYCAKSCKRRLPCRKGGFIHPKSCDKCVCPDGYGGKLCTDPGPNNRGCFPRTEEIVKVGENESCLQSPNYGLEGYSPYSQCNWILRAKPDQRIKLTFHDNFALVCGKTERGIAHCFHWVEVKLSQSLLEPGPKFCCIERPTITLTSQANMAVVSFRSNWDKKPSVGRFRGFRLCYKSVAA